MIRYCVVPLKFESGLSVTIVRAALIVRARPTGTPATDVVMIPFSALPARGLLKVSVGLTLIATPVAASAGDGVHVNEAGEPATGTWTEANHVVPLKPLASSSPTTRLTPSIRDAS